MHTLDIRNLTVSVENKTIIHDLSIKVETNEVVAFVGPNGHGKSSLLLAIMGHPNYTIEGGEIFLDDQNVLELSVDERARLGLFLAFQNPPEISGVSNLDFYKSIIQDPDKKAFAKFYKEVKQDLKEVGLKEEVGERELNVGFSGGEKKRHELMQMLLLQPNFIMLDEIDSGLDVDAIQMVGDLINKEKENAGVILISHYNRLFNLVKPTRAVVIMNGRIAYDGDPVVLDEIDQNGYQDLSRRLEIILEDKSKKETILLGTCAVKKDKTNG